MQVVIDCLQRAVTQIISNQWSSAMSEHTTWAGPWYPAQYLSQPSRWPRHCRFQSGCDNVDDNHHQMTYPILQIFNLLTDDRYILTVISCKPSCNLSRDGIIQISHTWLIFSVTPIVNGTGMRDAAECACFPVAVIYFAVVGMTSREISDDSWI